MKTEESDKERDSSAEKKTGRVLHWIYTRSPNRWFQLLMVIAIMAGSPGTLIKEAYGQGPELLVYTLAVLVGQSTELKSDCKDLQDALDNQRFLFGFAIDLVGRAEEICKKNNFLPSPPGPSTQSTNMRYPNYIAANQAGSRLFTSNFDSTVSSIDVAAGSPIGTIQFPSQLDGGDTDYQLGDIAINPTGTRLYVLGTIYGTALLPYTLLGNTVEVIDTEKNALVTTVPLGLEIQPSDVVVDATGSRVYVTTADIEIHDTGQAEFLNSGKVFVIDAASNTILKTIPISGQAPGPMVANPDGLGVYVGVPRYFFYSEALGDYVNVPAQIAVIDTAQNRIVQTIDLEGTSPRRIAINPTGTRLYVAHWRDDPFLEVIDTASNQVITKIDIPVDSPVIGDIQVTSDGAYLFMTVDVSTGDPDLIYIIDTATNTIAATVELPSDTQPGRMVSFITADDGQVPLSTFSSASLILQTPVIQVPGFGEYNASFVLTDPANLEVTLTDVSGTSVQTAYPALFSPDTGVLALPVLAIDGKSFFQVDLALVPEPDSLRFRVTRVAPLP